ncbi:MAG: sensor histidine kinase [Actinomycetota bacterium]
MPGFRLPRFRVPRRTARLRLTALYSGLFLLSGLALVAITVVLFSRATTFRAPHLPKVPGAPAITSLQFPGALAQSLLQVVKGQSQLYQEEAQPQQTPAPGARGPGGLGFGGPGQLDAISQTVTADEQQLANVQQQLTQAVHQVAQAGSAQAAQRAADSHQLLVDSAIALGVVALIAVLLGWLMAGRVMRPVRTITATARRISATNLHERLGLDKADDEFKQLGDTLDELFACLEAAFEAQRHFVANASHELRTPLTRERTLVQVTLGDPSTSEAWRAAGEELLASNREQEGLIEALLTLASSETGAEHREQVDLAALVSTVLAERGEADPLGVHVETAIAPAGVDGDPRLLESLVANLVDNALTHNVEGGRVSVSTAVRQGRAVLGVSNTGPVIPASEIERLFQPFQRLDPRRIHRNKGHGLGLSIVRAIATAHGATITADASPEGGIAIEVWFPLPAEHPAEEAQRANAHPPSGGIA